MKSTATNICKKSEIFPAEFKGNGRFRPSVLQPRNETATSYYFTKTLPVGFDEAVRRTTEVLKKEGIGIITEIDVKQTLKDWR